MKATWLYRVLLVMLLMVLSAAGGVAGQATQPAGKVALDASPYRTLQQRPDRLVVELPNRMIVVAQELRTAPVVSAQVWVKTGSIYEQEHVGAGLSHFLEHLLSGGTTSTRSEEESNAILGRIGAQTNAGTGLDNVSYYVNTTAEHAGTAIDLLSDWMRNATITQAEYEREREVIQREFEMGEGSPGRVFWRLTQQARYRAHPARHPTIGYLDEFLAVTREQITDFYKRMYVPNNMLFVVVGDIQKEQVVQQIAGLWAGAATGELPALSFPAEPPVTEPRELAAPAAIQRPRLRLAWPGTRLTAEGDYALDVLSMILGHGESSRLVRHVRDRQQVVTSISAYNLSFHWGEGFFGIDAEVALPPVTTTQPDVPAAMDKALRAARDAIVAEVTRIKAAGVSEQELARAKRQVLANAVYGAETAQGMAGRLARDIISTGDPDYLARYVEAIQQLTAQELQAAAKEFLEPQRMITVVLMPQQGDAARQPLRRPEDQPPPAAGAPERVTLDNAVLLETLRAQTRERRDQETAAAELEPIRRYALPNGLRLLVQRNTTIPAVAIQMYRLGGLLADAPGREGLANAMMTMTMKGTKTRSAEQIAQQIEDLGAGLSTQSGNNTFYVRGLALEQDWPVILELLADVTLSPTFPDQEWQRLRPRLLAAIARREDEWHGELDTHFRKAYFGQEHPWSQSVTGQREAVASFTVEDLRRFHEQHLGAAEAVLAVFGDVDPDEVHRRALALFEAMPAQALKPFEALEPAAPKPALLQEKTNKALAAVKIGFGPAPARTSPDYVVVEVLSNVMSSFPGGWLEQELRGRGPGLAYAVGSGQSTGIVPGYFTVIFNTQPGSVPEALRRALEVVARAQNTAVDEPTLARAKAAILTRESLSKQSNADRAAEAALNELYKLGLDHAEKYLAQIRALTAEELQVVAQTYLRNPVVVVLTHQPLPEEQLRGAMESLKEPPRP